MSTQKPDPKSQGSKLSREAIDAFKRELLFGEHASREPRDTRFQKGHSGNPRGRPPRRELDPSELASMPSVQAALMEGRRSVTIREGETSKRITVLDAAIRKQMQLGLSGNAYSLEKALQRQEKADRIRALDVAEDHERWERYCDDARRQFAEAKAAGQPEPLILPHPDDVIFVPGEPVRLRAPINQEQLAAMLETRKLCELLILQDAWDERCKPRTAHTERPAKSSTAMILCVMLNDCLPKRLRLSDVEIEIQTGRATGMTKRGLQKQLYSGWRALGAKARRGVTLLPFEAIKPELELRLSIMAAVNDGTLDPAAIARGEFNDAARAFFEEHGVPI